MAKQKKNSNYQTEKREQARIEKEEQARKEKQTKLIKEIAFWSAGAVIILAAIVLLLIVMGTFDYSPNVTSHAALTLSNGETLHIELYGDDAPETVKHFISLCESGYFVNMNILSLVDSRMIFGDQNPSAYSDGITGEFAAAGVENKITMKKGTLCLNRGEDYDSGYGQFFFLTKTDYSFRGYFAAFGRLTDMTALDDMVKNLETDSDGDLLSDITIVSASVHDAH